MITPQHLDFGTYQMTARKLSEGVYYGFGKDIEEVLTDTVDYKMLFDLRRNVYVFSGAKTYQQVREVSSLLTEKDKNEIKTFSDFKVKAKDILVKYNENYLSAEYDCAIKSGRSASQWMQFEQDAHLYPMLTYHTVGDSHVRPTHAELNNISRPIDDKFWSNYMPPNGWGCRCTVLQGDSDVETTSLRGFKQPKDVPEIFMMNPGKDRIVFSPKHPYFEVAPKDKPFAKKNWSLPIP